MTRLKGLAMALVVAVVAATGISGCGSNKPVTYAPAAYGEVSGGIGRCYFVESPLEATTLIASHRCQPGWIATRMPDYWHQRYYRYYSSPAYYTVYVPASARTVYVQHQRTYETTYRTQIGQQARYASYKGSNGKTLTGTKAGKVKFGSGTSFGGAGQKNGGGNLRGGAPAPNRSSVKSTSGSTTKRSTSTGTSGGSSSRGGSLRSSTGGRR